MRKESMILEVEKFREPVEEEAGGDWEDLTMNEMPSLLQLRKLPFFCNCHDFSKK